ncbi:phosphatase domain-containing putative toxin [Moraxella oblonga]|uniref:phosphatase domain-containing putative toxin n=1 Tax=Moraxella oblonga TaxID=200413 RepID=UPI00082BD720|nr:tyrosine-protein phosphatase [Moraxella oblonga]
MKHFAVFLLALHLIACATYPATKPRPEHWASLIKADANFYQVDEGVYRSEMPIHDDISHMNAQNIKTVINLQYKNQDKDAKIFDNSVTLINEPILTWHVRPAQIARALYAIEQGREQGGVLVHCYHGADRTGIVIAMYRVIYQGWDIESARTEMKGGGYDFHKIWKNLDRMLSPIGVAQVRAELDKIRAGN